MAATLLAGCTAGQPAGALATGGEAAAQPPVAATTQAAPAPAQPQAPAGSATAPAATGPAAPAGQQAQAPAPAGATDPAAQAATAAPATTAPATTALATTAGTAVAAANPAAGTGSTGTTGSQGESPAAVGPATGQAMGPVTGPATGQAESTRPEAPDAGPSWPMTIRDGEGRTVTIPARPQRILSLAPSNTEILFALGLGERVVGVDTFSDYPAEARQLPRVGDLWNPNYEAMIALQPDLVLAIGGSQKVWQKLEELGVPVVVIQPQTLADVIASIRQVGQMTGAVAPAEAVARDMEERLAEIQRRIGYVTYRPRVFWEVWHDPLMSAGPGSFFDDLIRLAGGVNLAGDAASAWPEVSAEAIIAKDPEVILTTSAEWANDLRSGKLPAWASTTAVRQGRIYVLEDNLVSRPGPRMIEGLEQVAKALMPLLYAP